MKPPNFLRNSGVFLLLNGGVKVDDDGLCGEERNLRDLGAVDIDLDQDRAAVQRQQIFDLRVVVSVDGEVVAKYPLTRDGVYFIKGYDGGTNTLVIKDGEAYISEASCPQMGSDVPCTKQGKISADSILRCIDCLPNHVRVEIVGGDNGGVL